MEHTERPQKPILEYQEHIDSNGAIVRSLTAESEQIWSIYIREDRFARQAIYRSLHAEKEQEVSDT